MPDMKAVYRKHRVSAKPKVVWRVISLMAASLLAGCQWLSQPDWMPDHWPWQDEEVQPDPVAVARQQNIDALIAKGNLAFTKDRLSVPANDNALMYYREVLKMDPGNQEAERGLIHVSKRFRKLARIAHDNGNGAQARKYLAQAESVSGADDPANQKLRRKLQSTPQGQNQRALDGSLQEQYKIKKKLFEDTPAAKQNLWGGQNP